MDSQGVRRRDTTRGPPLRVLSLDGGGVRGYSMLIIIQELMHRTYVEIEGAAPRRDQIPKPCDHFDLIVGTGTGGLIALMLGRLRLDLETCKELYVRLTRMVFETDKTIAGIPYRSTLFKASKLEEAIKECVQEHTVFEKEGNDGTEPDLVSPISAAAFSSAAASAGHPRRNPSNASVVSFSNRSPQAQLSRPATYARYGNANARLYDARENRTKTAVTAVYKGTTKGMPPAMLRSYDSRKEPAPEFDCKIWEAGRATSAIGLAFKPIQIGQTVFHDDGAGTFNPAPEALDEAVVNEWPGREVGVFVSVGTGKRPRGSDANQSVWYEGFMGEFAEARRRLISKIEGCEKIHDYMVREHLARRNVNVENYYRLNVEIGVGEFGMNEWNRLADISGGTRRYLRRDEEQKMVQDISAKLAKVHRAIVRYSRLPDVPEMAKYSHQMLEPSVPLAVELPAEMPLAWPPHNTPPSRSSYDSGPEQLTVPGGNTPSPRSSTERMSLHPPSAISTIGPSSHGHPHGGVAGAGSPPLGPSSGGVGAGRRAGGGAQPHPTTATSQGQGPSSGSGSRPPQQGGRSSSGNVTVPHDEPDKLLVTAPTPAQYRYAAGADKIAIVSQDEQPRRHPYHHTQQSQGQAPIKQSQPGPHRIEPPPLPPKTPLPEHQQMYSSSSEQRQPGSPPMPPVLPPRASGTALPYPMDDEAPPPPVNMARKPDYRGR